MTSTYHHATGSLDAPATGYTVMRACGCPMRTVTDPRKPGGRDIHARYAVTSCPRCKREKGLLI